MNTKKQRIPVRLLTGFLGSGKTTLLNRILTQDHGRKIAVIENEFGAISIDDQLLDRSSGKSIIKMNNGCLCCTINGDLVRTLRELARNPERFDYVVIESTGHNQMVFIGEELNAKELESGFEACLAS